MSEPKHTPGPWERKHVSDSSSAMPQLLSATREICNFGDCYTYYPVEGTPPNEADARLIAAAPELLEALKRLMQVGRADCICYEYSDESEDAWDYAETAIAKAEGGSDEES